ncbi:protein mono-ADP-ribosyltransferase PARP6 isoform X3 [Megalobrama amblycephala]|uniref:protein mono-ADP-ribosyltransferase PARP6 isoform X3 n=1 Tax=Megalobrama amblycephala TaxID=75352 RepID=UPI0020144C56|nr:protein mono-ADP-ribosyltransferase PARP6 isoform X3 [Megalobrama amblycephala]
MWQRKLTRAASMNSMSIGEQFWSDVDSDGDSDCEDFFYGTQCHYATDLSRHPQLDIDVGAVKDIYSESAVSVREYETIDDVDIDLHINVSFLDEEVASAWKVSRTEPIILRLRFSLSKYLDGPEPTVEVFQPTCKDGFCLGVQLKRILSTFVSNQWKHLSNEFLNAQQRKRHSWFKAGGTIKKFRAGLSIFSPITNYFPPRCSSVPLIQGPGVKARPAGQELRVTRLMSRSMSCTKGELNTSSPTGQTVAVPGSRSTVHITTRQLIQLFFSSQALIHCKSIPTLEYGFLVQVMKYSEQRIPTLNDYCVVCDEQHVFQNGSMLKPAVCTRELCVFSFNTLGVMSGAAEDVATGAEKRSYERLQRALDSITSIREITQGPYVEIKKQMDKMDPLAHPLLQWIISSNRSHIVKLPSSRQLKFMHTSHQFLLLSSPPAKEARFRTARKLHGSTFAFHGSHIENWHSILRNGLVNASYTKLQLHGAAYGKGIYLSPISSISFGYSGMGKGQHHMPTKEELVQHYNRVNTVLQCRPVQSRFLQSRNLNCVALCEVITSKDLQKHGNIWVCPISDHVCTRFFFVYEDGQVGDANINTQDVRIQKEILRVIGGQST